MSMTKHYNWVIFGFTAGILGMVAYIFVLLFGGYTAPVLNNIQPTDPVNAGSLSRYESRDCHTTNQEAEISRVLVSTDRTDPEVVIGLDSAIIRSLRCSNIVLIPLATPTGKYKLVITAKVQVNSIRTVIKEYDSIPFQINNSNPDVQIPPSPLDVITTPSAAVFEQPSSSTTTETTSTPQPNPTPAPQNQPQSPKPTFTERVVNAVNNAVGILMKALTPGPKV